MDEEIIKQLKGGLKNINERLSAIEREQRFIQQDILSGEPKESMQRRFLNGTPEKLYQKKEKIDNEIKIEI